MLTAHLMRLPLMQGLIDFAFPPLCASCGKYYDGSEGICERCREQVDWYDAPFQLQVPTAAGDGDLSLVPLFAAGNYTEPLRKAVVAFKFHGVTGLATYFAARTVEIHAQDIQKLRPDVLVPIPLHPSREYSRGYNQALVFAQAIAEHLSLPVVTDLLIRTGKRREQARLRQTARARNIQGVFEVWNPDAVAPTDRLLLVDDVVTSGQTALEARRVLQEAGFTVVGIVAIAHGL